MKTQPVLFVSHGAPTLLTDRCRARDYLTDLGERLGKPEAIVMISAHHTTQVTEITAGYSPKTIHDFGGFPALLYQMEYPAPGDPELAEKIRSLLSVNGVPSRLNAKRGFDHGAWVPLKLMYPDASVPLIQVSISMNQSEHWHYELGRALSRSGEQDVLIVGSGNMTHNLREFFGGGYSLESEAPDWVTDFAEWMAQKVDEGEPAALLEAAWRALSFAENHTTIDHILPFYVAMGAGNQSSATMRPHNSVTYGVLTMDVYGFGESTELNALQDRELKRV